MPDNAFQPTPYADINALLLELLSSVQTILGHHFIGMYLDGSLTSDTFDEASDIDFVVVTDEQVDGDLFAALHAMHDRLSALDSPWAIQLEGSYISQHALRRYDPAQVMHPNIERGSTERLKLARHDAGWDIHRAILRERGITLLGPPPQSLIDPVSPTDLRQAMVSMLPEWTAPLLQDPAHLKARGYQSYVVLSMCRALYTLHAGTVASKPVAARWAQEVLGEPWAALIERAVEGRHHPDGDASSQDIEGTQAFIRYTLERSV